MSKENAMKVVNINLDKAFDPKRRISIAFDGNQHRHKHYVRTLKIAEDGPCKGNLVEQLIRYDHRTKNWKEVVDISSVLLDKWPDWNCKLIDDLDPAQRVGFDDKNNFYLCIDGTNPPPLNEGEKPTPTPFRLALIYSDSGSVDAKSLFELFPAPNKPRYARIETSDGDRPGWNSVHGMPTIIVSNVKRTRGYLPFRLRKEKYQISKFNYRYNNIRKISLLCLKRDSDSGKLKIDMHTIPDPVFPLPDPDCDDPDPDKCSPIIRAEFTESGDYPVISMGNHGASNISVTHDNLTHIFWSVPGKFGTSQVHVVANTFDYSKNQFLYEQSQYVGTCYNKDANKKCFDHEDDTSGCNFDGHCCPTVTMDKDGYIHCIIGAHRYHMRHLKTKSPKNVASDNWESLDNFKRVGSPKENVDIDKLPETSFEKRIGKGTYATLCSDSLGNLHLVWRRAGHMPLLYSVMKSGSDTWDEPTTIYKPKQEETYHNYYHTLQYNRHNKKVYLSWSVYPKGSPPEDPKIAIINEF